MTDSIELSQSITKHCISLCGQKADEKAHVVQSDSIRIFHFQFTNTRFYCLFLEKFQQLFFIIKLPFYRFNYRQPQFEIYINKVVKGEWVRIQVLGLAIAWDQSLT